MYKQQPKSPLMKALIGNQKNLPEALKKKILEAPESAAKMYDKSPAKMKDLSGDGKVTKKDVLIGRGVLKADGSPAKQTTAGEFAYQKSLKDKEMGKSTKVVDKITSAIEAPFSDKTYKELKKEKRAKQKQKYAKSKSPAKNYKKGYYGV